VKISFLFKQLKPYQLVLQFVAPPLLVALFFFYKPQVDFSNIQPTFQFPFWLGIFLMPLNWVFEYSKWRVILKNLKLPDNKAGLSFASGLISEFLIPGIPSNFIGRIVYYEKESRFKLSAWIQLANLTQFFVTFVFGIVSMLVLNINISPSVSSIYYILGFFLLIILFLVFKKLKISFLPKEIQHLSFTTGDFKSLSLLFLLSFIRFVIFTLQFVLILQAFSLEFDFQLVSYIWMSYLFVSLSPSLFLGNLVIRESVTVSVFQLAHYPVLPVLYSTFLIWLVNNFLPVCLAWCYCTFFKKSE
jgi:hypothetical protein